MAMNRETKRMLQRQGQLGPDGAPTRTGGGDGGRRRPPTPASRPAKAKSERTGLRTFLKEVRAELRKVAWPTRSEVINYSIIVLITVVILTTYVALLDWGFGEASLKLFGK